MTMLNIPQVLFLFKYMWRRDYTFSISCRTGFKDSPSSSWQGDMELYKHLKTNLVLTFFNRNTSLTTSVWKKIPLMSLILLPLMSLNHPLKEKGTEVVGKNKVGIGSHEWKKRSYRNESYLCFLVLDTLYTKDKIQIIIWKTSCLIFLFVILQCLMIVKCMCVCMHVSSTTNKYICVYIIFKS